MPTQLNITGQTTFSQIHDTFANGQKEDFSMRLKGNTLYTKGKFKLDGIGQKAVDKREQRRNDAVGVIKASLTKEYGEEFAVKVMARLEKDRGMNLLGGGVLRRGEMEIIREAIHAEQQNLTASDASYKGSLVKGFTSKFATNRNNDQQLRKEFGSEMNMGKLRSFLAADVRPSQMRAEFEKEMISKLTPQPSNDGPQLTPKQLRDQTRAVETQARQLADEAMDVFCDEFGLSTSGDIFTLNEKGIQRLDNLKPKYFSEPLTVNEMSTLALNYNDPGGLRDFLDANPDMMMKLLTTPMPEQQFSVGIDQPGFNAKQFMQQLELATGFQTDDRGFHCDVPKLAELLQTAQGGVGVKPDLAYRAAVRLQAMDEFQGRIGGTDLPRAITEVLKADSTEVQKMPPDLGPLSQADVRQLEGNLGSPASLKQLLDGDRNLMIKLASCHPNELKGALSMIDRGGLSVEDAYQMILSQVPGHDAVKNQQGELQSVKVGQATYQINPDAFGDEGAFGDIFRMEKQGNDPGPDRIVLKKVRINPNDRPEKQDAAWRMMANEIRLHAHASDGSDKVVKFLDPIRIGDDLYMAMECADLGSLNKTVFENGVGKLAGQTGMEPKVELGVKLSFMQGMLEAMSDLDDMDIVHHDNKPGNYFMLSNGDIVGADLGTASKGPTSTGYLGVDNPEQQSPEGLTHKALKSAGPPYGEVTTKADSFALGVQFMKFMFGLDMFPASKFAFDSDKEDALKALYEHRDGFHMPPEPERPDPFVDPAMSQYNTDLATYQRMENQRGLLERAGFIISGDGAIVMFADETNPLHALANGLLSGDPARRSSAQQALRSHAMLALNDPPLQDALKEMRAFIGGLETVKDQNGVESYDLTDQQKLQKYNDLSNRISLLMGNAEIWDDMLAG